MRLGLYSPYFAHGRFLAFTLLRTRLLTAAVLIPVAGFLIYLGGLPFLALVALLLTLAELEFVRLVQRTGYRPTLALGIGLLWLFLLDAQWPQLNVLAPGLAAVVLASLAWQMAHRQGSPVADWALTLTGGLYLGLCGAALIRLRAISPDGLWWTLTAVPAIMLADSSAFIVGRALGRHKLAPSLSPGKTWEGYIAGIVAGTLLTGLVASLWPRWAAAGSTVNGLNGLILGLIVSVVAPLGDLAISMMKRSAHVKDSGTIIPGHGGALDRVDSILWAAVLGYYYVLLVAPVVRW